MANDEPFARFVVRHPLCFGHDWEIMDPWKGKSVESALHDLSVVASALAEKMKPYFEGDIPEDDRSWDGRLASMRRVLLHQANAITDVYGSPSKATGMRAQLLWDLLISDLQKFGIVLTSDEADFTFESTGAVRESTEDGAEPAG